MNIRLACRVASLAACLACLGCAGRFDPPPDGPGSARAPDGQALAPAAAMERIATGSSRSADVAAALGPPVRIRFDSGYEVWVYRWPGADKTTDAATELVLLLDSTGVVTKMRLRPGHAS